MIYTEPGSVPEGWQEPQGKERADFREPNLFFGGVQAVCRHPQTGQVTAAGDPRRGGAVAYA